MGKQTDTVYATAQVGRDDERISLFVYRLYVYGSSKLKADATRVSRAFFPSFFFPSFFFFLLFLDSKTR